MKWIKFKLYFFYILMFKIPSLLLQLFAKENEFFWKLWFYSIIIPIHKTEATLKNRSLFRVRPGFSRTVFVSGLQKNTRDKKNKIKNKTGLEIIGISIESWKSKENK